MFDLIVVSEGKEQVMQIRTVAIPESDLGQAPHVMTQFIDMLANEQPLSLAQQTERWEHLSSCLECQVFLGSYLVKLIEDDKACGIPTEVAEDLLARLSQLIKSSHETLKEDVPAYVEALEELREEDAKQRFPQLSEHVQHCSDCQEEIGDLRLWLRHLKEAELEQDSVSIAW